MKIRLTDEQWSRILEFLRTYPNLCVGKEEECRRFIGKIKYYRRIFSRFEKLAQRYLGFLNFVGTLI